MSRLAARFAVWTILLVSAALAHGAGTTQPSKADVNSPSPNPDLTPDQVVRIQVDAMRSNDTPTPDAGIATAFRFASPGNREKTGPLEHFAKMVKGPGYAILVNCDSAEFGDSHVDGDQARQAVKITSPTGEVAIFIFILSKQSEGSVKNCWMTDGVIRLRPEDLQPAPPPPAPRPGNNGDGEKVT